MNEIEYKLKLWPESLKKSLLRAAFLSGDEALRAWEAWRVQINMDDQPDPGSFRLLAQLYRNLQKHGIEDPLMMKFKGVTRQTWYKNQRFFRSVAPLLRALGEVEIESMLLYGPALALQYYQDYVLNGGPTLTILVRSEQAATAIKQLQALGWASEARLPAELVEPYIASGFMHFFRDALERRVHLHWHLLPECCQAEADDDFWAGARATKIQDVTLYTLNPADQVLHICAQDSSIPEVSQFGRAIDVMLVLNAVQAEFDWERLVAQAQKRRLLLPLLNVLGYLQDNLDEPLPPAVWQQLKTAPISTGERLEYKFKTSRLVVWRRFLRLWFNYSRRRHESHWLRKIIGFPQYLQHFWRLEHLWQVPLQAVSAARHRARGSG